MSKFVPDEKRSFKLWWIVTSLLFALSTVWAVYAELYTRVAWQEHQREFFELEQKLAAEALGKAQAAWDQASRQGELKKQLARQAELQKQKQDPEGDYQLAQQKLAELDRRYQLAERQKTFAQSLLDEAYYLRTQAEYERDAAQAAVHRAIGEAYPADEQKGKLGRSLYQDPPPPPREPKISQQLHHLQSEAARSAAHTASLEKALQSGALAAVTAALERSLAAERAVITHLAEEQRLQRRIDAALAELGALDGPDLGVAAEPGARAQLCRDRSETRSCLKALVLEPLEGELGAVTSAVSRARRPLDAAQLRLQAARKRLGQGTAAGSLVRSLVGPYEIRQVVTSWLADPLEVDRQQVDRCQTCHLGADSGHHRDPGIKAPYRTHPQRQQLFGPHPVERFGCTPCHQGQGRATDDTAHSGHRLRVKHGRERWQLEGDPYWEDLLLPVGELTRIAIDAQNDELTVKIGRRKGQLLKLAHGERASLDEVLGALQEQLQKALAQQPELVKDWHAVVRRLDHRVTLGLEQNDPDKAIAAADRPGLAVELTDPQLGELLGFGRTALLSDPLKQAYTAAAPPHLPVRQPGPAERGERFSAAGRYAPARGAAGLQIPDEARNRFIRSLPLVESGCQRCHRQDVDLVPRRSAAEAVQAKLDYQRAEAELAKDRAGYIARRGTDALPPPPAEPSPSLSPTYDEGRQVFQRLRCTGCHVLEGFAPSRDGGPGLDALAAKVSPEWLLGWLRNPRGWRAKTAMPSFWPRPLEPASKQPYPEGSPQVSQWRERRRNDTLAVAAYLLEASAAAAAKLQAPLAGALIDGTTAARGKLVFEAYGCQGCHARSDSDTAPEPLPEPWRSRERDLAPTLVNLATKVPAEWLAYWVADPSRYWPGTRMPRLRLTAPEAASVARYLGTLESPPLIPLEAPAAEVARLGAGAQPEKIPCSVAGGAALSLAECGRQIVRFQGCYGCHRMAGFEAEPVIGPELDGFAGKDVVDLDFGYAISDPHLQTRETFLTLKLDSPRIFVRDRIELKMGDLDASPAEIRALIVLLRGTVVARPNAAFDPVTQPSYAARVEGRQLIDDLSCRGCHVIEGRGGDIDGFRQTLLRQDAQQRAPILDGEGARAQSQWLFSYLRDPGAGGVRPWLNPAWAFGAQVPDYKLALRMPTFNLTSDQWAKVVRYFAAYDGQTYPYQAPAAGAQLSRSERLYVVQSMQSTCLACHYLGDFPVERGLRTLETLAPNLAAVRGRLRPEWVKLWLLRPQNWLGYSRMTAFWATVSRPRDAALWPKENDPFLSPPAWGRQTKSEQQVELVRDFLFTVPPGVSFPDVGQEELSPLVDPSLLDAPLAAGPDAGAG